MTKLIDPIIDKLNFKSYISAIERRFERFLPGPEEPKSKEIPTPRGDALTATAGDYLVSEIDVPDDRWSVHPEIFEESYEVVRPGGCVKTVITNLVHLVDVTEGDSDQLVTVYTLEDPETVWAGEFCLVMWGIQNEIWTYAKDKCEKARRVDNGF